MAKSKKKRQQFKDFQKVKLKVGKKIAKPDNVTNTFFKTRSIKVREKLRADNKSTATTKRKLTITDLLSQCEHFTASKRQDAVSGIRELLSVSKEAVIGHFAVVVCQISSLFVDKDASVRASTHRLLRSLLPHISLKAVTPFFKVISVYLSNAMTHINEDIQEDSLKLLDILLCFYPTLVVSESDQILFNFIEQISKQSSGKVKGSQLGTRVLHVNPNSRLSNQKWRIKVLERFQLLLSALFTVENVELAVSVVYSDLDTGSVFTYSPVSSECFRISEKHTASKYGILEILKCLSPIMFQCWLEAKPDFTGIDNYLSVDAVGTLKSVLSIFNRMMRYIVHQSENRAQTIEEMRKTLLNDFINYFLAYFPYSQKMQSQPKKNAITDVSINLTVVELFSYFITAKDTKAAAGSTSGSGEPTWCSRILDFIFEQLEAEHEASQTLGSDAAVLLDVVEHLFTVGVPSGIRQRLVCALFSQCKTLDVRYTKRHINLLTSIVQRNSQPSPQLTDWLDYSLSSIPHLHGNQYLIGKYLTAIRWAGQKGIYTLTGDDALHTLLAKEFFCGLSTENQTKTLELVGLAHHQHLGTLKALAIIHRHPEVSEIVCNSLLEVLNYNFVKRGQIKDKRKRSVHEADYVSFLLSLIAGTQLPEDIFFKYKRLICDLGINLVLEEHDETKINSILTKKLNANSMLIQTPFYEKIVISIQNELINFFSASEIDMTSALAILTTIYSYHTILSENLECKGNLHNMPDHKQCQVAGPTSKTIYLIAVYFSLDDTTEKQEMNLISCQAREILINVLSSCCQIFSEFLGLCGIIIFGNEKMLVKTVEVLNQFIFHERVIHNTKANLNILSSIHTRLNNNKDMICGGKIWATFDYEFKLIS